ncbi:MAG: serpin family protein [Candidatus Eremiobacteraeota bacterium]|nr:serpin family protein [Candidatus Eremiobacteraeota bacterium]
MFKRLSTALAAAGLLVMPLVSSAANAPVASLATPYAQFGFDLLRVVHADEPNTNVFVSPTGIAVALAFASDGARGATRDGILGVLHASGSAASFDAANRALARAIAKTTAVKLTMANALWLQSGFAIEPQFVTIGRRVFGAQAANLDFRMPGAAAVVNAWAKAHTNGLIPHVLDSIDPATVVMIANAIAFDGKWTLPFDRSATKAHPFRVAWTKNGTVKMMHNVAKYAYADGNGLQAIRLQYADRSFAMYVVLPKDAATLDAFVKNASSASFDKLRESLVERKGSIALPRFHIAFNRKINGDLARLGMSQAFQHDADFGNIHAAPPVLAIGDVHHASYLNVDEAGTQAAAVTTVGMKLLSMHVEEPPFAMVVDRPFVVAIRDETTGQLLFLGTIVDPG